MTSLTIRLGKSKGGNVRGGSELQEGAAAVESTGLHQGYGDLPVAKGASGALGNLVSAVNLLGNKADRKPGNKVHFCVRCDFPIAVYGRLEPCQHVFCLSCAKKRTDCYLCDEKIARIQKMDMLEGMYVCGAPACLYSFLTQEDFEWHIREAHTDLLRIGEASQVPLVPSNQESSQQYQQQFIFRQRQLQQQQQEMQSDKRHQKRKYQEIQPWNPPGPGEGYSFDQWNQLPMYHARLEESQGHRLHHPIPFYEHQSYESSLHLQ